MFATAAGSAWVDSSAKASNMGPKVEL